MRINTNLTAMNTFTQYTKNNSKIASSVAKLSSGSAINSAADNATGLAISEKMRAQIRGLEKASTNAQDAISLVQSAEGALSSSTEILQRMRELAVQSASDTNENEIDRTALQDEFSQLQSELNDIAKNTTFNKKNLLDGSLAASKTNVNITNLTNSTTAVSVGEAAAGNYSFTVSVKQETAAINSADATGTASRGTTANATISAANVLMGTNSKATALYNGNYTLESTVDEGTGSVTVKATGDNGQTFTGTMSTTDIDGKTSLSLKFETSAGADDSFSLTLDLKSATEADSTNALQALATAINDVTVSIDGGVDAVAASYGVYGNLTGANSVKLNAGDASTTFGNGVTVSFDKLTATDVAVDSNSSIVLSPTDITGTLTDGTAGAPGIRATVTTDDLTASFAALESGDDFIITVNGTDYSGIYKGETGADLDTLLTNTLTGSASKVTQAQTGVGYAMTMGVSNGVVTYSSGSDLLANSVAGNVITMSTPAAATQTAYTASTGTAAATYQNDGAAGDAITAADWNNSIDGDKVYVQIADQVIEGTFKTDVDTTLSNMLSGTSFTDKYGESFSFTGVSGGVFTYTGNGGTATHTPARTADTNIEFAAGGAATGNKGVLSDGLVSKLGKTADQNSTSTTATTFSVDVKANAGLTFQVGANQGDEMTINIAKMDSETLGVISAKVSSRESAKAALSVVDSAINKVSAQRAYLGAIQNRLDYKISNLNTSTENLTSAESQIRDVDMAKEMTAFTNANILNQASTAMLAQANSLPQAVLSLIGG